MSTGSPDASAAPALSPRVQLTAWAARSAFAIECAVAALAALFLVAYGYVALRRLAFPFDLEWMEGALVQHVARAAAGAPIYARPTLEFTPFLYPPLYYYVSAAVACVTGMGFLPLRLVSIVSSAAIFVLSFRLAQRETGRAYAGVLAAGLFAATYRIGGAWLDLARNDSLFLALTTGAVYLIRWRESTAGWAGAGVLLAFAALTKQTAILMAGPLLVYAALVHWRRAAWLASTFAAVVSVAVLALTRATHGWFLFYVVRLPEQIQRTAAESPAFWRVDLLGAMPIGTALAAVMLVSVRPWRDRRVTFWPALAASGIGAAFVSRLHSGAYHNVLLPAYWSISLLAAIAGVSLAGLLPTSYRSLGRIAVALLCAWQLVALRYAIADQIPSAGDRLMAAQLGERLAGTGGETFVPYHSFVPSPAGPIMHAHAWAIVDVLRGGDTGTKSALSGEIAYALAHARFRLVVIDKIEPWMQPHFDRVYQFVGPALPSDGLWTKTGYRTRPRAIYAPRGDRSPPQ